MKILITGSSGLIGTSIISALSKKGFEFIRLVRKSSEFDNTILWDPESGKIDKALPDDASVIIHLCGQNLISKRWSKSFKKTIYDSRINSTQYLSKLINGMAKQPKLLISASAVGYYGDHGDKLFTENESHGTGFLADVCRDWENETTPIINMGVRVVLLRLGVVLSQNGGALKMMTPIFKLGLGDVLGDGSHYMSWIAIDDVVNIIEFIINNDSVSGPVNAVSPNPVTNKEFTKALGAVLSRPTLFPLPKFLANLVLGEIADELLLASARVAPEKLNTMGYAFKYPALDAALRHILIAENT